MKPLQGVRVVEFEGLGPCPMAGRFLADLGAEVTVIGREGGSAMAGQLGGGGPNPLNRGKTRISLNLKTDTHRQQALAQMAQSDALLEGFRPGVMERLGLGPADCAALNPRLVYGRMTGWGQTGPLAQTAGHDLNYLALSGLLAVGTPAGQTPRVPPTVLGDAGGALALAFGVVSGVLQARTTGRGCVVDAAITDTAVALGALVLWMRAAGQIDTPAPSPFHQSPFYDLYACADGQWLSVAALEAPFYAELLARLGLHDVNPGDQYRTETWPALKARIAGLLASQPRAHWEQVFAGSDACVAPVLSVAQALQHPQHVARETYPLTPQGQPDAAVVPRLAPLS